MSARPTARQGPPAPPARGRLRPGRRTGFSEGWDRLTREIEGCTRCPLHRTRRHVVVYRGSPHPRVLFVGEAPGAEEDAMGRPFVGRSGRRLDRAIELLGLSPEEYGILNVIKCRPPGNRFLPEAALRCRPFLERQLALLRPSLVVTLGARALAAFDPTAPRVTEVAGRVRQWGALPLVPLLHPAAALHAPRLRARWDADLATLADHLEGLARRR